MNEESKLSNTSRQMEELKEGLREFKPVNNFSVPNVISLLRIVMIPVILLLYLRGYEVWAAAVVVISGISDAVDGFIARRLNQITPLGKVLDPIADKLTQVAIAICLCISFRQVIPLMIVLVFKEIFMLILGLKRIQLGLGPFSACWWGKLSTMVFYVGITALMLFGSRAADWLVWLISILICGTMVYSMLRYVHWYYQELPRKGQRREREPGGEEG